MAMGLALAAASPGVAQQRDEPDAMDVARTPLEDFNIDSDDLPPVLVDAAADPYDVEGLLNCNHLMAEIAALDNALGDDFDIFVEEEGRRISGGRVAQSVVGSFIPFRGLVREVSGANKRRREFNRAVTAGMVRRGFLKGVGRERGCNYPARPRTERPVLPTQEQDGQ
ncbi:hypothetical protein NAP1_06355 [Erythrobacter sp. NAP1]|nr:hypothetical protein NAP1_06355 [Erythrobacter sp. NAP1]